MTGSTHRKSCPPEMYNKKESSSSSQGCLKCASGTINLLSGGYECYPCLDGCLCPHPAQKPVLSSKSSKCMEESIIAVASNDSSSTASLALPSFPNPPLMDKAILYENTVEEFHVNDAEVNTGSYIDGETHRLHLNTF